MSREQAKQNLIGFGIAEPTDEMITNYLNQVNGESNKEKALAEKYKSDSLRVKDLEAQLEEINNKNLSDIERAQKDTETANKRVADLEAQLISMQRKNKLAEFGIVGEDADKLFDESGAANLDVLGQIISNRETLAKAQKEKELLNGTPNPTGGNNDDVKTSVDLLAESVGKELSAKSNTADILSHYT